MDLQRAMALGLPVEIEPWKATFAFGLYGIMLTSLIVGVLLTIIYRQNLVRVLSYGQHDTADM